VYKHVCIVTENIMSNLHCFWSKYNYIGQKKTTKNLGGDIFSVLEIYMFVLIIHYDSTYANILGGSVITCACVAGKIGSSVNIVNSRTSASLYQW
jgi:hypothetical protein